MVRAGKNRTTVTIESRVETVRNAMNEVTGSWTTHVVEKGFARAIKGREFLAGGQVQADVDWLVDIRSNIKTRLITPKMRVTFNHPQNGTVTKTLEIVAAYDPDDKRKLIQLACKELLT